MGLIAEFLFTLLCLLVLGAAAVGWLVGGPSAPTRRLLARVTAMRNVGLGLLIAIVGVPHGGVGLAIVGFVVVLIVLRVIVAGFAVVRRRRLSVDHAMPSARARRARWDHGPMDMRRGSSPS